MSKVLLLSDAHKRAEHHHEAVEPPQWFSLTDPTTSNLPHPTKRLSMSASARRKASSPARSISIYLCRPRCIYAQAKGEGRLNWLATLGAARSLAPRTILIDDPIAPQWHEHYAWAVFDRCPMVPALSPTTAGLAIGIKGEKEGLDTVIWMIKKNIKCSLKNLYI